MKTAADIGEFGLIQRIQSILSETGNDVLVGIGDDAAVFMPKNQPIVVSTDAMVQDIHFKLDWASAEEIAHKALASSLSDLAAKAAIPAHGVITVGLPGVTPIQWIESFYQSLAAKAKLWQTQIIGGDTVSSEKLWFSLTVWGYQSTAKPIRINHAQPGDSILVTGTLGDAAGGLQLLKDRVKIISPDAQHLINRFSCPTPRLREALQISSIIIPSTMTDISDGISRDLKKIGTASKVGAIIDADKIPVSSSLKAQFQKQAKSMAWQGGEDYELLLTLAPHDTKTLLNQWDQTECPLTVIGEITDDTNTVDVKNMGQDVPIGFEHFK